MTTPTPEQLNRYADPRLQRHVIRYSGVNMEFASTESEGNTNYQTVPAGAYAQRLAAIPGGTPDPMRKQSFPVRDYRPDPKFPPQYFWTGPRGPGKDEIERGGVEFLDGDGKEANLPVRYPQAPNPKNFPPPEPRPTNRLSPSTYTFTRPFDQNIARRFTGDHFSMADHRRRYPILGMAPVPYRRNTYRADPTPWDVGRVDMPNPGPVVQPGSITAYEIPPSGDTSWRL